MIVLKYLIYLHNLCTFLNHFTGISPKSNATINETIPKSHSLGRPKIKEKKNSNSIDRSSFSQLGIL